MTEQIEKILLSENTKAIQVYESELKFRVEQTKKILNRIAENYSFDSLDQIPNDVDGWILKLFLIRNKKAKEQFDWQPFGLNEINLPEDLKKLRADLSAWAGWSYKEMTAYLTKDKDGLFIENQELTKSEVQRFKELQRIYISGEQIIRLKICNDILNGIQYLTEKMGLNFNSDSVRVNLIRGMLQKIPFISYLGFKPDGTGNRFTVNEKFILTGDIGI